jgi:hypothetical protein
MDLIYADVIEGNIIDRGVLNNYSFDMSFGEKENDFQLKAPLEGTRLEPDQIIYISGTEYGGVIDSVQVDTANLMMIYAGRTWHGILENKILYPLKGVDYMYLQGDANEVLAYLLERMNIIPGDANELYVRPENAVLSVSEEESGIDIDMRVSSESGNYAHGYTFIRDMLYRYDAKLQIIDGVLSAVPLVDYSNNDDFLEGTDQFTAKRNYNSLNRLHCMGQGNLANRYTIDLYLDDNGGLLPYSRENPVQDSDYYTDIEALSHSTNPEDVANFEKINKYMVTGINEIADVYDYPNIQNTYHYVPLISQPSEWESDLTPSEQLKDKKWGFQQYFQMKNNVESGDEYENVPKPSLEYRYNLQYSKPADWDSNFANYYMQNANGMVNVTRVETYSQVTSQPADWYIGGYENYYKLDNNRYVKVRKVPGLVPLPYIPANWYTNPTAYCYANGAPVEWITSPASYQPLNDAPGDWASNYGSYYQTDGVNFTNVSGVSKVREHAILTTQKPTDWANSYKNYWYQVGKPWVHPSGKKAPKWKPNKYYMDEHYTVAPTFKKGLYYWKYQPADQAPTFVPGQFFTNGEVVPTWGTFAVFQKSTIPTWQTNKYFTAEQYQPIPIFKSNTYFKQYEDHYEALVEAAKNKIAEYMSKDDLTITLDDTRVYDINDRVGASDEVTGLGAVERIVQKIIKINRGIVSFDYNTGK